MFVLNITVANILAPSYGQVPWTKNTGTSIRGRLAMVLFDTKKMKQYLLHCEKRK